MLVYLKICFSYIPTPYHKVLLRAKYQISVGLHYSQDDTDENDGYMTSPREESSIGLHSTPLILSSLPYLFYSYYIYTWGSYGVLRTYGVLKARRDTTSPSELISGIHTNRRLAGWLASTPYSVLYRYLNTYVSWVVIDYFSRFIAKRVRTE